ncbi:MAG: DUF1232 domain-containing protein [Oscillospiraceae bacterium]|nr:DUF1232 domain-containing protein [Oscillospiraceae bacterium]MBQ9046216.1 DUF1232 domain-containing protein [Oscillospiraceae bacterium]
MQQAEIFTTDSGFDRFFKTIHNAGCDKLSPILGQTGTDIVLTAPDLVYLLAKLVTDRDVPSGRKLDLLGTLLYLVSPFDLFPDKWKLLGKIDDAYVTITGVAKVLNRVDMDILERYWLGNPKVLTTTRSVLNFFDEKFGSGFLRKFMQNAGKTA